MDHHVLSVARLPVSPLAVGADHSQPSAIAPRGPVWEWRALALWRALLASSNPTPDTTRAVPVGLEGYACCRPGDWPPRARK